MEARIFFCHGSRCPSWRAPFDRLVENYQRRFPSPSVQLAFLEWMAPTLPEALEDLVGAGHEAIRIYPVFLAPGAHTQQDLPALVDAARQRWPGLQVSIAPTLLESPAIRVAVVDAIDPLQ